MASDKYTIRCDHRVAIVHIRGSWGERTTRHFVRDFKAQVEPLLQDKWAQLVYFDEWQFSSPGNEPAITELLVWSIENNLSHSARVFKPDPLKSYQLNRMMDENEESMNIRHFFTEDEGFAWLAEQGFPVSREELATG